MTTKNDSNSTAEEAHEALCKLTQNYWGQLDVRQPMTGDFEWVLGRLESDLRKIADTQGADIIIKIAARALAHHA
jgi:hypothetical protein